jgi:hypothetical protein
MSVWKSEVGRVGCRKFVGMGIRFGLMGVEGVELRGGELNGRYYSMERLTY